MSTSMTVVRACRPRTDVLQVQLPSTTTLGVCVALGLWLVGVVGVGSEAVRRPTALLELLAASSWCSDLGRRGLTFAVRAWHDLSLGP